jgi:hypothetical protein
VSYDLTELLAKLPYDTHVQPFDDNSHRGVFACRWLSEEFDGPQAFLAFLSRFDCVLQPLIQGVGPKELAKYFVPNHDAESYAVSVIESHPFKAIEALHWLRTHIAFAAIPWLRDYQHGSCIHLPGEPFPELVAMGSAGYLNVFVADLL